MIEIKAKYTAVSANPSSVKGYRITYKGIPKGVKNPNPKVVYKTYKLKSLKRKEYIFKEWYSGKKKITKISKDITITAKWKKRWIH